MADEILDGSCLCGAVRYRVRGPFMRFVHCHCSRCRKATGSAHATNLIAEAANLEWIAGQDHTQRFDLPNAKSFATTVCRTCGSPVPRLSRDGQRSVIPAGSLDSTPTIQPTARIYWESRTPWSCAGDELHHFPEGPA